MSQTRGSRLRNTIVAVAVILVIVVTGVGAQQKLSDFVAEGGFDWMIGRWEAIGDEGDKIELIYKWELNKHLVTMQLKWPNNEFRAMIFYKPTEDKIVQITVDNQGGTGNGVWEQDGDKAVLKHEHTGADSQVYKMGFVHSKVDDNTMKWEGCELYGDGELSSYPNFTLEFKRQPKPPTEQ